MRFFCVMSLCFLAFTACMQTKVRKTEPVEQKPKVQEVSKTSSDDAKVRSKESESQNPNTPQNGESKENVRTENNAAPSQNAETSSEQDTFENVKKVSDEKTQEKTSYSHGFVRLAISDAQHKCGYSNIEFSSELLQKDFSPLNAGIVMHFAKAIYNKDIEYSGQKVFSELGFTQFIWINKPKNNVQVFLVKRSDVVLIVFRGLQELRDWILNFQFFTQNGEKFGIHGWVHAGFLNALTETWPSLLEALRKIQYDSEPIILAGHSLGGSLAHLAALKLAAEGKNVAALYTFGEPRTGDKEFAARSRLLLKDKHWRVTNALDMVPHLPPTPESAPYVKQLAKDNKVLALSIEQFFKLARYSHGGLGVVFNEDAKIEMRGEDNAADDVEFWKKIVENNSKNQTFADIISQNTTYIEHHQASKYWCNILKNIKTP